MIIARSVEKVETRFNDVFTIVDDAVDDRSTAFLDTAQDFSSRVVMPPALLPGEGFS